MAESPDSFFNHQDNLEIQRYDTVTLPKNENEVRSQDQMTVLTLRRFTGKILSRQPWLPQNKSTKFLANFIFRSLLDHGGSHVMMQRRCMPRISETFTNKVKAYISDAPEVEYDLILGRNFWNQVKIDVLLSQLHCTWFDDKIPFHPANHFADNDAVRNVLEVRPFRVDTQEANYLAAAKSTRADIDKVCRAQEHIDPSQKLELLQVLRAHEKLFDGSLGYYPKLEFSIKLKADTIPYHCNRPYPVPNSVREVFKAELERQCEIGVLQKVYESEWGMPVMVIPKKDGSIRTVDDFRELNKWVIRREYPLPRIQNVYHHRQKFEYMTILDLTACYYTYHLTEASPWYCVLVTPFGKYRRLRLPMEMS